MKDQMLQDKYEELGKAHVETVKLLATKEAQLKIAVDFIESRDCTCEDPEFDGDSAYICTRCEALEEIEKMGKV